MKSEAESEVEPEIKPEPTSSERHYYVTVSDRAWDPETVFYPETSDMACEIDQKYEDAGAVYIGELTKKQLVIFEEEFKKLYKGQYVVGFGWEDTYPPENLSSRIRLNHYAVLSDDQKRVLDIAAHLANSIRNEDGCGNKNVVIQSKLAPIDETKGRWVSQDEFLKGKKLKPRTLQTYRSNGKKSEDGLSGIDSRGNRWKKKGTGQNEKPEYFLPNDK